MQHPDISVILPTYNHLDFLPTAVEAILKQDFDGTFELVIVNDASTDETATYLDSLDDPRVRVITHEKNSRLPTALNTGMKAARGEFVTWTSADNIPLPNYLKALHQALKLFPQCGFACTSFAWINEDNVLFRVTKADDFSYPRLLLDFPGCAAFMYRRELHEQIGYYNPELEGAEDWDMWVRIMERTQAVTVPEVTYLYRCHSDSMTARIPDKVRLSSQKVVQNAFGRHDGTFEMASLYPGLAFCRDRKKALAEVYCDFGSRILMSIHADDAQALSYLQEAIRLNPQDLVIVHNYLMCLCRVGEWRNVPGVVRSLMKQNAPAQLKEIHLQVLQLCEKRIPEREKRAEAKDMLLLSHDAAHSELWAKHQAMLGLHALPWHVMDQFAADKMPLGSKVETSFS